MLLNIAFVPPETTYPLRHSILRPHQAFIECQYDTDHLDTTFHLGAYVDRQLVSIASFSESQCDLLPSIKQYRLRAMATEPAFRNQNIGKTLILNAEKILIKQDVQYLWCQARVEITTFYEKVGFEQHGMPFKYPGLGLHVIMAKRLSR